MVFLVERGGGSVWPAVALQWAANTHPSVLQSLLPYVDGGILPGGSKGSLFYLGAACTFAASTTGFSLPNVQAGPYRTQRPTIRSSRRRFAARLDSGGGSSTEV